MSKALDALMMVTEIQNKQTALLVDLAIAFGAVCGLGSRPASIEIEYTSSDVADFLKLYKVATEEIDGKTHVTITARGQEGA